ncbi:MAG: pectinesterase family protein [Bacteroidales bacterium]|jgi:pectinesterase|nr:pectinesterase family protein [Bacteroidales bacterium]MCI2122458.1 pectinesterase family protein [Bacteroidales bacterium]MCI2145289.1 pectinesterase family protein [Bacteroidales bacterium]
MNLLKKITAFLVCTLFYSLSFASGPYVPPAKVSHPDGKVTVFLMGDSTMAEKDLSGGNPERGWGMMLPNFLDSTVRVINYAQNGRSTKSFIDRGLWKKVMEGMKAGDYVFVEFGHNDSKKSDTTRYAAPWGAFQDNLRLFVRTALEKGVHPVLLTPVARRYFDSAGVFNDHCHGDYPAAMKQVAKEFGVPLIDMTAKTNEWLRALGDSASRQYFMWIPAGTCVACPEGKRDNTHTKANGARKECELVCEGIGEQLPELAKHLVKYDIVVSQDGHGDYMTVQEAVNAVPDYAHNHITRIFIHNGVYHERVTIPHNKFRIFIQGESEDGTIITYGRAATQLWEEGYPVGTSGSATMYIHSDYVTLQDLTVENSAGDGHKVGQAVAVHVHGSKIFFNRCRFLGNQDTFYAYGKDNKFYVKDCYIEGTTDFIFGFSQALFENCEIHSKDNSFVTAASTLPGREYGFVFKDCRLTAGPGVTRCYLGRPWKHGAQSVFINCWLGPHIRPEGWSKWNDTDNHKYAYFAEYGSYGPGASPETRAGWSHQLGKKDLEKYTYEKLVTGDDGWDPYDNR